MEQYAYKILDSAKFENDLRDILLEKGEDGWEVVCPLEFSTDSNHAKTRVTKLLLKKKKN